MITDIIIADLYFVIISYQYSLIFLSKTRTEIYILRKQEIEKVVLFMITLKDL